MAGQTDKIDMALGTVTNRKTENSISRELPALSSSRIKV